jgi:hypothetical protein
MNVELNEQKVRTMATRLRDVLGREQLGQGRALETLAALFGYKNWDLLSGMLKRDAEPAFVLAKPVTLYLEAFSTGPESWASDPDWAKVLIDQAFIDQLLALQALCKERELSHVAACGDPTWQGEHRDDDDADEEEGDDDDEAPVCMDSGHLYVSTHSWWYHAVPRHASYAIETRLLDIGQLLDALAGKTTAQLKWFKDVLVLGSSYSPEQMVRQLVDDKALDAAYLPE